MNYKFQVGDLVRWKPSPPFNGFLGLVTGRRRQVSDEHNCPLHPRAELYTLLLSDGKQFEDYGDKLRKVSESNEV
jgi:hypothetical protein